MVGVSDGVAVVVLVGDEVDEVALVVAAVVVVSSLSPDVPHADRDTARAAMREIESFFMLIAFHRGIAKWWRGGR